MSGNCFELIPGLWVGNIKNASDYNLFKKNSIKCIVNCENDLKFLLNSDQQYESNVINSSTNIKKTVKYLNEVSEFIYKNLQNCSNILVYCNSGLQFSPTIVLAFIIRYAKVDKIVGINYMLSKNDKIFKDIILLNKALEIYNNIYFK